MSFWFDVDLTKHSRLFSLVLFRDVRHRRRHFPGALEATVVGKRDAVLPCVHDWIRAYSPDNTIHFPGACQHSAWTNASASHLCYGKLWTPNPKKWVLYSLNVVVQYVVGQVLGAVGVFFLKLLSDIVITAVWHSKMKVTYCCNWKSV